MDELGKSVTRSDPKTKDLSSAIWFLLFLWPRLPRMLLGLPGLPNRLIVLAPCCQGYSNELFEGLFNKAILRVFFILNQEPLRSI